jgi:hypothetical protein
MTSRRRGRAPAAAQASTRQAESAGKAAEDAEAVAIAARRDADRLRGAFEEAVRAPTGPGPSSR